MMRRKAGAWVVPLTWAAACLVSTGVRAQSAAGYGGFGAPTSASALSRSPFANPYANPFINPYMMQYSTSPGNAALYFFAAQQATGGLGSGQLSGVRPGPRTPGAAAPAPPELNGSGAVPSSVSRYFLRGPLNAGTGPYYNRQGHYYTQNRR